MSNGNGRILVLTGSWSSEAWLTEFRRAAPGREFVTQAEPGDATIRYAAVWRSPPGLLASLPALEVIFSLGAGVDHLMSDPQLPDIPLVRAVVPDLSQRMSEYILWQALDHLRRGRLYRSQQANGIWRAHSHPAANEVTVGIMGYGVLGRDAAPRLQAAGFRVIGWSRSGRRADGITNYHGQEGLDRFLAEADIVAVLLPLTQDTRGIINYDLLSRMKGGAAIGGPVLINAGRGGLQVEKDILRALDDGALQAVTLDVFEQEPLPADSPLWHHPRVTITPHDAAGSEPAAMVEPIIRQIENLEKGLPLTNLVDRNRGY